MVDMHDNRALKRHVICLNWPTGNVNEIMLCENLILFFQKLDQMVLKINSMYCSWLNH